MLNLFSAAGTFLAFNVISPKYADLSLGLGYGITLVNTTASDVTSGAITFEAADASTDDHCVPGTFAPLPAVAACDAPPGYDPGNAVLTITAQNPIKAHSQCTFSVPCPKQFLRVSGAPAALDVIAVVTPLKRTDFSVGTTTGDIESFRAAS
jgi:hypothetical protein